MDSGVGAEMPRYRCHKEVWALKIKKVEEEFDDRPNNDSRIKRPFLTRITGAIITPDEPGYAPFHVTTDYMQKHRPQPGGYYVVYKDGYTSYSPAQAFEEGYTRIDGWTGRAQRPLHQCEPKPRKTSTAPGRR